MPSPWPERCFLCNGPEPSRRGKCISCARAKQSAGGSARGANKPKKDAKTAGKASGRARRQQRLVLKGKLKKSWHARWTKPPLNPVAFALKLREALKRKAKDPEGLQWPWTSCWEINNGYFLSEDPKHHKVTQELDAAAKGLSANNKVRLSVALRYRESPPDTVKRYRQALLKNDLDKVVLEPVTFGIAGPPYRTVVSKEMLAESLDDVAAKVAQTLPNSCAISAPRIA